MDTSEGRLYGLRFRNGPIYGDLVSLPTGSKGCRELTFRVQRSARGIQPERWKSNFALGGADGLLWGSSEGWLFDLNPAFPPGYP